MSPIGWPADRFGDRDAPLERTRWRAAPPAPVERHRELVECSCAGICGDVAREQLEVEINEGLDGCGGAAIPRRREDRLESIADEIEQPPPAGRDVAALAIRGTRGPEFAL